MLLKSNLPNRVIASGGIKGNDIFKPERSNPLPVAEVAFGENG